MSNENGFGTNVPTMDDIIKDLATHYRCPEAVVLGWLTHLYRYFDPKQCAENLAKREGNALRTD